MIRGISIILSLFFSVICQKDQDERIASCSFSMLTGKFEIPFYLLNGTNHFLQPVNMNLSVTLFNRPTQKLENLQLHQPSYEKYTVIQEDRGSLLEYERFKYLESLRLFGFNQVLENFPFLYGEDVLFKNYGFSFMFKGDREFSLVHFLKERNMISHLSFSFEPGQQYDGLIVFGRQYKNVKRMGSCKVDTAYSTWGCTIKSVSYNEERSNIISYNDYASFQSEYKYIIMPCSALNYIQEELIYPVANKLCRIVREGSEEHIHCNGIAGLGQLPYINFNFETMTLSVKLRYIFSCTSLGDCKSLFHCYSNRKKEWVFGSYFLRYFKSIFDYEEENISFISTSPGSETKSLYGENKIAFTSQLMIYNAILCSLAAAILLVRKMKPSL